MSDDKPPEFQHSAAAGATCNLQGTLMNHHLLNQSSLIQIPQCPRSYRKPRQQDTMAQRLIELSCERFRRDISDEDDKSIRAASLDDVRVSIRQIETQLAARQSLRNLERLIPFLDAIERYSKAVDPLCNGVPFLPYIWVNTSIVLQNHVDRLIFFRPPSSSSSL